MSQIDKKLMTVKQFTEAYPWVTESGLRALIFKSQDNKALSKAFLRLNRRVLVDVQAFFGFLEDHQQKRCYE